MRNVLDDVIRFHALAGIPIAHEPVFPSAERIALRLRLIAEEHGELIAAITTKDMVETADAIADLVYVAIGMAVEFGIPLTAVWNEVQRSNMAKRDPITGEVLHRADGKVLKPEGWTPPDIASIIKNA